MRSPYTCSRCLSLFKPSRPQLRPTTTLRPPFSTTRFHSAKCSAVPPSQLSKRNLSSTSTKNFKQAFEPYEYIDPEGVQRKLVLTQDNLFHPFTHSPIPE